MYLSKRVKVVAGVSALLGLVMVGGAGFTATGIVDSAGSNAFVGGSVSQTVGGITLASIQYQETGDGSAVDVIELTFGGNAADLLEANTVPWVPTVTDTTDTSPATVTCAGVGVVDAGNSDNVATANVAWCDTDATNLDSVTVTLANDSWTPS